VNQPPGLWKVLARALEEARLSARRANPEGLHELRVALRHVAVTAQALRRGRLGRETAEIAQSLKRPRRLEVDRQLLERVGRLGLVSPDAVTALAALWDKAEGRSVRELARATDGKKMQRVRRRLVRLARKGSGNGIKRLTSARREAEAGLARALEGKDDATLRRCRGAARRARSLADDLVALGLPEPAGASRERDLQDALGRWKDLRRFRKRLSKSRTESEWRGAVTLAAEIERLLAVLEPSIQSARAAAVTASRTSGRVVPIRSAAQTRT
jgi:CHAD domain-containing protein